MTEQPVLQANALVEKAKPKIRDKLTTEQIEMIKKLYLEGEGNTSYYYIESVTGVNRARIRKYVKQLKELHPNLVAHFGEPKNGRPLNMLSEKQEKLLKEFTHVICPGYQQCQKYLMQYETQYNKNELNPNNPLDGALLKALQRQQRSYDTKCHSDLQLL